MDFLLAHKLDILNLVLSLLGVFSVIAKFTPTQADDKALATVYAVIHKLGLTK